jgi:hypothetical protein
MVYHPRISDTKSDPVRRWKLPDRVFFAAGACHILAYAFLERFPERGGKAIWLRPLDGSPTNHIFVDLGDTAFDFHGYVEKRQLLEHFARRARLISPDWSAEEIELPRDFLVSEAKSKTVPGLWLREPGQFLFDALPRARAFLDRFEHV